MPRAFWAFLYCSHPDSWRTVDKEKAILNLTTNIGRFPQLPFISDLEVTGLLGAEVSCGLELLDEINREKGVCSACGGRCCQQLACELFAPEFGRCPIHEYRPLLCRFHYCERFGTEHEALIRELIDIFTSAVSRLEAECRAIPAMELNILLYGACRRSDEPCPWPIEEMRQIVESARRGETTWPAARRMLGEAVRSYRTMKLKSAFAVNANRDQGGQEDLSLLPFLFERRSK